MRVLTIVCLMLSGCSSYPPYPPSTTKPEPPLVIIKDNPVNAGKKPPVTRMEMINGELYIY